MWADHQHFEDETLTFQKDMANCSFKRCTVTFMKKIVGVDFEDCPAITVMGNATGGHFTNCKAITVMGDCKMSSFTSCSQVTLMGDVEKTRIDKCPNVTVMGDVSSTTRDGEPFVKDVSESQDVIQTRGSGNVVQGRTVYGSVVQTSRGGGGTGNYSYGNVVRGTTFQSGGGGNFFSGSARGTVLSTGGGDNIINGNRIPAALGYYTVEMRGGRLYGKKRNSNTWDVYDSSRGSSSEASAWVPADRIEAPLALVSACQKCGTPTDLQEKFPHPLSKSLELRYFCTEKCQKSFYSSKK